MAPLIRRDDAIHEGISNPRGDTVVIVNIILTVLSTLLVATRFYARIKVFRVIGPDDWTILAVAVWYLSC